MNTEPAAEAATEANNDLIRQLREQVKFQEETIRAQAAELDLKRRLYAHLWAWKERLQEQPQPVSSIPHWIPVVHSLPTDPRRMVWVKTERFNSYSVRYTEGRWVTAPGSRNLEEEVTHWMLPLDGPTELPEYRPPSPSIRQSAWGRERRQKRISEWCVDAFGKESAFSLVRRGTALLEEALGVHQACGGSLACAHLLVEKVFEKEPGNLEQEMGGVGISLLALAQAARVSVEVTEIEEAERVLSLPVEHFRKRDQAKSRPTS